MLKAFFSSETNKRGRTTFLSHGTTVEGYEKPILTELGSILELTEGSLHYCRDHGGTGKTFNGNDPSGGNNS